MQDNLPNWPDKRNIPPSPTILPAPEIKTPVGPDNNPRNLAEEMFRKEQERQAALRAEQLKQDAAQAQHRQWKIAVVQAARAKKSAERARYWSELVPYMAVGSVTGAAIKFYGGRSRGSGKRTRSRGFGKFKRWHRGLRKLKGWNK